MSQRSLESLLYCKWATLWQLFKKGLNYLSHSRPGYVIGFQRVGAKKLGTFVKKEPKGKLMSLYHKDLIKGLLFVCKNRNV